MTARGWNFPWRKVSSVLELTLLERGASDWRIGRWTGTRGPGSVSVVNAGRLAVGTRIHAPGDFFGIEIEPSLLGEWRLADAQLDGGPAVDAAGALARLVRAGAGPLAVESTLWALLAQLRADTAIAERGRGAFRPSHASDRMREVILARYDEPLSLAEIAREANVSRFHGVRVFRDAYGVTPFEYLTHVRLERAAAALRAGTRPVDAAARVGFADQAHLTRWFGRMFRVTPAAFARAHALARR